MRKIILLLTPILCVLFAESAFAQYSAEAFELKEASDLYDERGYNESSSIAVDGNLTVSTSTGVPSYVYPISSHTISGYPLDVTLNYAGSVAYTTFDTRTGGITTPEPSDPQTYYEWSKFQENRPAWILGVNEFAVQVLHNSLSFHSNPEVHREKFDDDSPVAADEITNRDLVWLVDGYSFSNRMFSFGETGTNNEFGEEDAYVDVIKILKTDGSVMELVNSTASHNGQQLVDPLSPNLYTGHYAVNSANAQGFAIVEYDPTLYPPYLQEAGGDSEGDLNYLRPRKVRYFPGDGLEYVFREWITPYGIHSYNGNYGTANSPNGQNPFDREYLPMYGLPGRSPSIFYLDELIGSTGTLTKFKRSRHYTPDEWMEMTGEVYQDETRGRALTTEFDGHEIEYLNSGMIIKALGRTTKVEFHKVMTSGYDPVAEGYEGGPDPVPDRIGNTHLEDYGYRKIKGMTNQLPDHYATMEDKATWLNDPLFYSYDGFVTRIIDPMGRTTTFAYDSVTRRYKGFNFPRQDVDLELALGHFRLTEVVEPTAKYEICYQNLPNTNLSAYPLVYPPVTADGPAENWTSCSPSPVDEWEIHAQGTLASGEAFHPFLMNDIVHGVTKSHCDEDLTHTTYTYEYLYPNGEHIPFINKTTVITDDLEGNAVVTRRTISTTFDRSVLLPNSVPGYPRRRFTGVTRVEEKFYEGEGVTLVWTKDRETAYPTTPQAEYVVLPIRETERVNGELRYEAALSYVLTPGLRQYRDGEGNLLAARTATYGTGLAVRTETLVEGTTAKLRTVTEYRNIPYDSAITAHRQCGEWDKLASLDKYYQVYPNKERDWEDVGHISYPEGYPGPQVAVYTGQDFLFPVPPVYGLVARTLYRDPAQANRILAGTTNVYATHSVPATDRLLIGRVLETYQLGNGGLDSIRTALHSYQWMGEECRLLPASITNANGAVTRRHFDVSSSYPVQVLHNDDRISAYRFDPALTFSRMFEAPVAEEAQVRRIEPSNFAQGLHHIVALSRPTYYGLKQGAVDPNGWYSHFDYDFNGRIVRAILPGDFRSPDAEARFSGTLERELAGLTDHLITRREMTCLPTTVEWGPSETIDGPGIPDLKAGLKFPPPLPICKICDCTNYPVQGGVAEKEGEASTQDLGGSGTTDPIYEIEKEVARIHLVYVVDNDDPDPLVSATSLTDAYLRLTVMNVSGECVTMRVTSPELPGLRETRVFGDCSRRDEEVFYSETELEKGRGEGSTQGEYGCDGGSNTPVGEEGAGGLTLKIPVDPTELMAIAQTEPAISFYIEVLSPNTEIVFAGENQDARPRLVLDGIFSDSEYDYDYTLAVEHDDENLTTTFRSKVDDYLHTSNTYISDPANPDAFYNGDPGGQTPQLHAFTHTGPQRRAEIRNHFGADYRLDETEIRLKGYNDLVVGNPPSVLFGYTGAGLKISTTDQEGNTTETAYDPLGREKTTTFPAIDVYRDVAGTANGIDDDEEVGATPQTEVGTIEKKYVAEKLSDLSTALQGAGFGGVNLGAQTFYQNYTEASGAFDENGVGSLAIYDARGNLRCEIAEAQYPSGPLQRHTRYEYDLLNRLVSVSNPLYQVTYYAYDLYGRVLYKTQPDIGTVSHAYDDVGNVRFTQSEQQAADQLLTFYQYDDLNRLTIVGEARFVASTGNPGGGGPPHGAEELKGEATTQSGVCGTGGWMNRLSDQACATKLNLGNPTLEQYVTVNPTLWMTPTGPGPVAPSSNFTPLGMAGCILNPSQEDTGPVLPPLLVGNVKFYEPVNEPAATLTDFENLAKYPNHPRMGIHYDHLPASQGPVWGNFPMAAQWNQLAPPAPYAFNPAPALTTPPTDWATGSQSSLPHALPEAPWNDGTVNEGETTVNQIRNTVGREAAVAYREHAGEAYHYTVTSYDERGRVEAVLHYTENLGFDAVYYDYNSMNKVTRVRVVDPYRQHTTWYGYDVNGRLDTVWTKLSDVGTGLAGPSGQGFPYLTSPRYPTHEEPRPSRAAADILYAYDDRGLIDTKRFRAVNGSGAVTADIAVDYTYNERGWLTEIESVNNLSAGANMFMSELEYDPAGQIKQQSSKHGANVLVHQWYEYDGVYQLKKWRFGAKYDRDNATRVEAYNYDHIGNRLGKEIRRTTGTLLSYYNVTYSGGGFHPNAANTLNERTGTNTPIKNVSYTYDLNGSQTSRQTSAFTSGVQTGTHTETFKYGYRNLPWKFTDNETVNGAAATLDMRYRYNPRGEREGKRIYAQTPVTPMRPTAWTYYLLDGQNRQLAVWRGQEANSSAVCPSFPPAPGQTIRYMYPTEYLTYGAGSAADIITKPDNSKRFKLTDHLGSTRMEVDQNGGVTGEWNYEPFGKPVHGVQPGRKGFIDKEADKESGYGNFGVRQYDYDLGRFVSTDPLWEKYLPLNPYQYAFNSPLRLIDRGGKEVVVPKCISAEEEAMFNLVVSQLIMLASSSPTINTVLERTFGPHSEIHVYVFSRNNVDEEGNPNTQTDSELSPGQDKSLEDRFYPRKATGVTGRYEGAFADVMLDAENLMNADNVYAMIFFAILDEFNHATETDRGSADQDHVYLFCDLLSEIESGQLDLSLIAKTDAERKFIIDQLKTRYETAAKNLEE